MLVYDQNSICEIENNWWWTFRDLWLWTNEYLHFYLNRIHNNSYSFSFSSFFFLWIMRSCFKENYFCMNWKSCLSISKDKIYFIFFFFIWRHSLDFCIYRINIWKCHFYFLSETLFILLFILKSSFQFNFSLVNLSNEN